MTTFAPLGPTYRPTGLAGWLFTVLALAFIANCFVAIDRHSHSVSDTFYGLFPYAGVTLLLWDRLAQFLSRTPG
ncbi:MAG: hypothetical protein ABIP41_00725 [Croceibacterium sp.]